MTLADLKSSWTMSGAGSMESIEEPPELKASRYDSCAVAPETIMSCSINMIDGLCKVTQTNTNTYPRAHPDWLDLFAWAMEAC